MAFQYLKGGYKKERDRLFSRICGDRTGEDDFKLKGESALAKLSLDSRV